MCQRNSVVLHIKADHEDSPISLIYTASAFHDVTGFDWFTAKAFVEGRSGSPRTGSETPKSKSTGITINISVSPGGRLLYTDSMHNISVGAETVQRAKLLRGVGAVFCVKSCGFEMLVDWFCSAHIVSVSVIRSTYEISVWSPFIT